MAIDIHLTGSEVDATVTTASWDNPPPVGSVNGKEYPVASDGVAMKENNSVAGGELGMKVDRCPDMRSITTVKFYVRFTQGQAASGHYRTFQISVKIAGTWYRDASTYVPGNTTQDGDFSFQWRLWTVGATNPATGLAWTAEDIRNARWGIKTTVSGGSAGYGSITGLDVVVNGDPYPINVDPTREVLSRLVRESSAQPGKMNFTGRLNFLDPKLGDMVDVSDIDGEEAAGLGWGFNSWERRIHEVQERNVDLDNMTVGLLLQDVRLRLVALYNSGLSASASAGDHPGLIRLDPGAQWGFQRPSLAWATDLTDGRIKPLANDVEALGAEGEYLERGSTCWFPRCAMKSGLTGITINGSGLSGSVIVADSNPADRIFSLPDVAYSMGMLASTNPAGTGDLEAVWPTSASIAANTIGTVSIRYQDYTTHWLSYWVKRGIDNKYWRESDQTWQAAKTWNPLPSALGVRARYATKPINVGAGATTITLGVGVPGVTGFASQNHSVFKVQGESLPWASSDMVCDAAVVSRAVSQLYVTNNLGKRTLPSDKGSLSLRFYPFWSSANLAGLGLLHVLWYDVYDSNNYQTLFYDGNNGWFRFDRKVAGVLSTITFTKAVTRGTPINIVVRWVGPEGSFGRTNGDMSFIIDGVEGAWAAGGVVNDSLTPKNLYFHNAGTFLPEGALSYVVSWYFPLTLAEAKRLPL